ncbi:hypothetical protein MW887_006727 [Aspergillus wentii]|nr:hypothetical protein MW887_006727 [Aspergillus wentii]
MDISHVFILLVGVALVKFLHQLFTNPLFSLPGPWHTNYTQIVFDYHWLKGNRTRYVHALHLKYGPIVRITPDEVSFSDPESVKQIYRVKGGYRKSPWYESFSANGTADLFSTCDTAFHSNRKRLLAGPLSETSMKQTEPLVDGSVKLAIEKMQREMASRGVVDVFKWWLFMASDIVGELTFGESFRMLELGRKNQYIHDLQQGIRFGALQTQFPASFKLLGYLQLPMLKQGYEAFGRLGMYAKDSIQRYKSMIESNPTNPKTTFFTKLFNAKADGLSDIEIQNEAQSFIIAGSDTTANTLTYIVWSVSRNDKVKARLLHELRSLPDGFGYEDLRKVPYLDCVITETLRLYAPSPSSLPRVVPPEGAELANYRIPGGTTVSSQAWSLHRDPVVFPNPQQWIPSRWENPSKEMQDAMMPFGAGSRICVGLNLARMEICLAAARFFLAFPDSRVSCKEDMRDEDMEAES